MTHAQMAAALSHLPELFHGQDQISVIWLANALQAMREIGYAEGFTDGQNEVIARESKP